MTFDAVIVLANEMDPSGALNTESVLRANLAARLLDELPAAFVVTCGWAYRKDSCVRIADAFKSYLVGMGVKPDKIITEITSRDTVGDAVFTKLNVAEPRRFTKLCVVTSNYHVPRTSKIFNFVYGSGYAIRVEGANVEYSEAVIAKELASERAFAKTFSHVLAGNNDQIMDALRCHHPFYNGEIYPEI
ncbi:MAG: YdcF family protein [Proteobacteria bacterium]|nr:YdcF family protein [Pseudomonadota bacterium]